MVESSDPGRRRRRNQWLLVLFVLTIVAASMLFLLARDREQAIEREGSRLRSQASAIDKNIGQQLVAMNAALEGVRNDMAALSAQRAVALRLKALSAVMPGVRTMLVMDSSGVILAANRDDLVGRDMRERSYFQIPKANPRLDTLYVSEPFTTLQNVFSLNVVKIWTDTNGQFAGIISATLDPAFFAVVLSSALYAPDMRVALAHQGGKILLGVPENRATAGMNLAVPGSMFSRHVESGKSENLFSGTVRATGDVRQMAIRSIAPQLAGMDKPLVLAVSREIGAILAPWRATALLYAQMYGLLALLLVAGVWLFQRNQTELHNLSVARDKETAEHAQRMELALGGANLGLWDLNLVTGRRDVNARARQMVGDALGEETEDMEAWRLRMHPDDLPKLLAVRTEHETGNTEAIIADYRVRHRDGHWVWIHSRGKVTQRDAEGKATRLTGTLLDITERKHSEAKIAELAFQDPLTSLPNRRLLMERLGQALLASARSHKTGAVLLLDLDHFKWVNDNLGHDMGDVVLQQVAARLEECVRHSDTVARLGGDEFVVLLQNLGNSIAEAQVNAEVMARKIATTLRMPFNLEGHEHTLGASVGIALFAGEDRTAESLLKQADQAMYAAKRTRSPALPMADSVSEA